VKGIVTCMLVLHGEQTLFLHDVLYVPNIHRTVLVLLKLGFNLYFHENDVNMSLKTSSYGIGYFLDGFIVLDVDYNTYNVCFSLFASYTNYENDVTFMAWKARSFKPTTNE